MIITAVIFIILGILIKYGKMYFLIAGYNTMPKEKKARYDIEGIASLFGNVMFGMALTILLGLLLSRWTANPAIQSFFFFGALAIGIPYLLIKSNSNRYKREIKII